MFSTLLSSLAPRLLKFELLQFKQEFAKDVDASTQTLGSNGKTIRVVALAEPVKLEARQDAGNATFRKPTVAFSAMLDVKIADLKDDSEDELESVRALGFWPALPWPLQL